VRRGRLSASTPHPKRTAVILSGEVEPILSTPS
jgi:hypothetical protein